MFFRSPSRRIVTAVVALCIAGFLETGASLAQTAGVFERELVVNGGAEANVGAAGSSAVVKPSGWDTTGEFTAVKYGAPGGFPDATSPGPVTRGKNLFEGGNVGRSTATQTISLAAAKAEIDAGSVRYDFSAWIGGFATQDDDAIVSLAYSDSTGTSLGSAKLGPVTAAERKGVTGLLRRYHSGIVPKGTESAVITIEVNRFQGGYNDGAVDNVSLKLHKAP